MSSTHTFEMGFTKQRVFLHEYAPTYTILLYSYKVWINSAYIRLKDSVRDEITSYLHILERSIAGERDKFLLAN